MSEQSSSGNMRSIGIGKVTLNIGVGETGEKVDQAKDLLESIVEKQAVKTYSKEKVPGWGIRPGLPIGVKVTLRDEKAKNVLSRLFKAVDRVKPSQFDDQGNLSFGIDEYVHIPGTDYNPDIEMYGIDVCVTLERPGYSIKKKKKGRKGSVGDDHRISTEEAIKFIKDNFEVKVREKKESRI